MISFDEHTSSALLLFVSTDKPALVVIRAKSELLGIYRVINIIVFETCECCKILNYNPEDNPITDRN